MPKPTKKSDIETALEKLKEAHKSQDLAAIDTALNDINAAWQAASVRRLGLITFRIAMILTSLRVIDGKEPSNLIVCGDSDFQTAITMARVLLQHTDKVFGSLPPTERTVNGNTPQLSNKHSSTIYRQSSTARRTCQLLKN